METGGRVSMEADEIGQRERRLVGLVFQSGVKGSE